MKKFLFITSLLIGSVNPASAYQFDAGHQKLVNTLSERGVVTEINPNDSDCVELAGWYWLKNQQPTIGICAIGNTVSENDNTLRHEAFHYLQDCASGYVNGRVNPYFENFNDVVKEYGTKKTLNVYQTYTGSYSTHPSLNLKNYKFIRAEVEAFYAAEFYSPVTISNLIEDSCPIRR